MSNFIEKLLDSHPLSKAERMLTGNPITTNYVESVFTGDANITFNEFSPAAQSLLTTIVNEEAKKGNNSIGPQHIKKYLPPQTNTNISSLKAITNPSPYDEIWFTLGKFDTVASPPHNEFYIEDTYDTSAGYNNMMLRGLSAVDRFAQKYEHGNKPKNQFRMSIPMLSP